MPFHERQEQLFKILSKYRCHVGEGVVGSVAQKRAPQYYTSKDVPPRFGCLFYPDLDGLAGRHKTYAFLPLRRQLSSRGAGGDLPERALRDPEKILLSILRGRSGGCCAPIPLFSVPRRGSASSPPSPTWGRCSPPTWSPKSSSETIVLIIAKALNARFVTIKLEYPFLRLDSQRFTYGAIDARDHGARERPGDRVV